MSKSPETDAQIPIYAWVDAEGRPWASFERPRRVNGAEVFRLRLPVPGRNSRSPILRDFTQRVMAALKA